MFFSSGRISIYNWIVIILIFSLAIGSTLFLAARYSTKVVQLAPITKRLTLGVHDPSGDFDKNSDIGLENYIIRWDRLSEFDIAGELGKITAKKRIPMITIDPYPYNSSSIYIFNKIIEGQYDNEIKSICTSISKIDQNVLVRWGRNMDFANIDVYPWANSDAFGFQSAYKYFVDTCRSIAANTKYVWSPSGLTSFELFYPEARYVDIIAFSIYSNQNQNENQIMSGETGWPFEERLSFYYDYVKNYNKPIMIAEMGAAGRDDAKIVWVTNALRRVLDKDVQRRLSYVVYDQNPINPPVSNYYKVAIDAYKINPTIFKK